MSEKSFSKRSANFNPNEIDFLIKNITAHRDIIESKKTDRATSEEKVRAWKNVERKYNSRFGHNNFRSAKVLKTKYENLKKNVKKILRERTLKGEPEQTEEKCLEEIAFMDETEFSTDKLLTETVREYFEENLPENGNSSPTWHAVEVEEMNETDEEDDDEEDSFMKSETRGSSLLMPMFSKSFDNTKQISALNRVTETPSMTNEGQRFSQRKSNGKVERISFSNDGHLESSSSLRQKKSSIQLFCDSLAMQIEEAHLTPHQLSSLQIDMLKKLQEYLPNDK